MMRFLHLVFLAALLFQLGCKPNDEDSSDRNPNSDILRVELDLPQIVERGKLVAAVENSTSGFFILRGRSLGFQYELLQNLAGILDLELQIKVTPNLEQAFTWLETGKVDIVAFPLTITRERKNQFLMTDQQYTTRQVLVQRKPNNWKNMKAHEIERALIRNQVDLVGKKVHVRYQTAFIGTLRTLSDQIGGDILIVEEPSGTENEDMIRAVADGQIEYAISDEDVATLFSNIYTNVDVNTPVSFPTQIGWALRKNSIELGDTVNYWIRRIKRQPTFNVIYNKYYRDRAAVDLASVQDLNIESAIDLGLFEAADTLAWDWRLLIAQIYQESRFNPRVKSWAGAVGLMQVLPSTGRIYKIYDLLDPKKNVIAGTSHLLWLKKQWNEIEDEELQTKFVLASYNVGLGHIQDVQALARKYKEDPYDWSVVEKYLLLKKKPKYFKDPVVKYGYCRGDEPVNYVREILSRYHRYEQVYPDSETIREEFEISQAD